MPGTGSGRYRREDARHGVRALQKKTPGAGPGATEERPAAQEKTMDRDAWGRLDRVTESAP